jgi:hypothetical protein
VQVGGPHSSMVAWRRISALTPGAKLTDKHFAATVHCVDDEIIGWP